MWAQPAERYIVFFTHLCEGLTYQRFYCTEVFYLVSTKVEMCEVWAFICQNFQTTWDPVITEFKLSIKSTIKICKTLKSDLFHVVRKKRKPTFLSLFSFGKWATVISPTLIVLRNSSSSNSSVRPSIFPSFERQLSSTSSFTCWTDKRAGM